MSYDVKKDPTYSATAALRNRPLAAHNGECPLCDVWISKGVSHAPQRLTAPVRFRGEAPRSWAHDRCKSRYEWDITRGLCTVEIRPELTQILSWVNPDGSEYTGPSAADFEAMAR